MNHRIYKRIMAMLLAMLLAMPLAAVAEKSASSQLESNGVGIAIGDVSLEGVEFVEDVSAAPQTNLSLAGYMLAQDIIDEQSASTTSVTLGVGEKYTIDAKAVGSGKKVTYKTTKKSVATVSSKGVIKGVKKGSAKINCYVGEKLKAIYEVKVVKAPTKVTLSETAVTLGVKDSVTLTASIASGTHATFTWSSKDKTIATVTKAGRITGKKAGKTTITVKTHNGKTATCKVTVMKAPGKVTLNKTSATLNVKGTLQLKATLPSNTYSRITWSSSNAKVAKVSASGKVTAVAVGSAKITAKTYNGKTATCKVTVKSGNTSSVKYRALLIGEERFDTGYSVDMATRNRYDVGLMADMLKSVKGLYGGSFSITRKYDLSASQTLKAIKTTFADADSNDVSLFFIATHGDVDSTGVYAGSLAMSPSGDLMLNKLADALKAVPGKVIVILESCGAGAAVYANNGSNKLTYEKAKKNATAFDAAVIKAFSKADSGIEVELQPNDIDSSGVRSNTGEFRVENKFYVLAASRYQELSWGVESELYDLHYNYFTLWLTQGIGTSGKMPADTNNNGQTTLNELYKYISRVGDNYPFDYDGTVFYQHVQVYPANSSYVLFKR